MSEIQFEKISLFPKKQTVFGIILLVLLFTILISISLSLWNSLKKYESVEVPIIERSAINVRLIQFISYQLDLAIKHQDPSFSDDLKENIYSLKQNLKMFNKLTSEIGFDANLEEKDFLINAQMAQGFIKNSQWKELSDFLKQSQLLNQTNSFSVKIFDITEKLGEQRDGYFYKIKRILLLTSGTSILIFLFLFRLIKNVMHLYSQNVAKRVYAENTAKLLSKKRQSLIHLLCHDLHNPISAIYGLIDSFHLLPQEEKDRAHETIKRNTEVSMEIIELTRKLEALEIGKLKLDVQKENLLKLIKSSLNMLDSKIKNKKIKVDIKISDELTVSVDKIAFINSCLNNVLSNAIKFTPQEGEISIQGNKKENQILLEVQDNGIGIPDDILAKIFDETKATSRPGLGGEPGTGLGMPLAKKFVEAMGGELTISSSTVGDTYTKITFKLSA